MFSFSGLLRIYLQGPFSAEMEEFYSLGPKDSFGSSSKTPAGATLIDTTNFPWVISYINIFSPPNCYENDTKIL